MNSNLATKIKQKIPFKNEYVKAQIGLIYIANQLIDHQQTYFKQYGLTLQQYNVLRILRGQFPKPSNISMIRDRMLDKMCDGSRIVDRLVKLNFAIKTPSVIDKRNTDVFITDLALDLLAKIDQEEDSNITFIQNLTEEEILLFNSLINKMLY